MKYWVVKGKPWNFGENSYYKFGQPGTWYTSRPPKDLERGDRLFIWQSSPALCLVMLAEMEYFYREKDRDGRTLFEVVYLTRFLDDPITIDELRQYRSVNQASFLKPGPFATVYPLKDKEGENLFRIVAQHNPNVWDVWPDISIAEPIKTKRVAASSVLAPPARIEVTVNRVIRDTTRAQQLKIKYGYYCQVCCERIKIGTGGFYAEVHHIRPLGRKHQGLDEEGNMIVLCPNHHAMFDYGVPLFLSPEVVKIGRERIKLMCKHMIYKKNIYYHNKKIYPQAHNG